MMILPVLDLCGGKIVRGLAGRRNEYRPIRSQLSPSSEPTSVAAAFVREFGLTEQYVADLDAIAGAAPAREVYARLHEQGLRLWIDAGIRSADQARTLRRFGAERVVVGLETVGGPAVLSQVVDELDEGTVFSLDLRNGEPLGDLTEWPARTTEGIAEQAVASGVRHIIVLDLARVGGAAGIGTEQLCIKLARQFPHVSIYAGGGVRGAEDLRTLRAGGLRGVLIASALHDRFLSREDLARSAGP